MLIKVLFAAAAAAVSFAGVFYAVNKTADRMEDENEALPESEQRSEDELNDDLLGEFIEDVKSARPVKFVSLVLDDIKCYMLTVYEYRVKIAIGVLAISTFSIPVIPAAAARTAYIIIGEELLFQGAKHAHSTWWA